MADAGISFIDGFSCLVVRREDREMAFETLARKVCALVLPKAPKWFAHHVTGREEASHDEVNKGVIDLQSSYRNLPILVAIRIIVWNPRLTTWPDRGSFG